ncbi:hypothetical protein [Aneurinibacillus aneurinilyticus]|jgi:hypothetical protein|uniref:Uncharacterized protein n=1 Tax=Aneurinibacillus aneurinilyticus TaxID=1391 RepID=A0A848CMB8_ANEAE|nr:hypothetical protein [Aneurinibacillus aneurinilyticus]MCI1692877.1 hypothetical protein [Aneurinibacillus aneurinilyticus]NME96975.1 hypothetical protein [Aneurinibacillus aneurinilyticus]
MEKKQKTKTASLLTNQFAQDKNQYINERMNAEPLSLTASVDIQTDEEATSQENDYQFLYWQ